MYVYTHICMCVYIYNIYIYMFVYIYIYGYIYGRYLFALCLILDFTYFYNCDTGELDWNIALITLYSGCTELFCVICVLFVCISVTFILVVYHPVPIW